MARPGNQWRLEVSPSTSTPVGLLSEAKGRRVTWNLSEPSTVSFSIDGRLDQAFDLIELASDVHLSRATAATLTTRVMASTDSFDDATHTCQFTGTDYRGLLARRLVQTDRVWQGYDVAYAVRDLLNDAQSGSNTPLGITVPPWPASGVTINREVKAGQTILSELQAIQGGDNDTSTVFDWDIAPGFGDARVAQLWIGQRGRDLAQKVVLDYQYRRDANGRLVPRSSPVAAVRRSFDPATYANSLHVTGGVAKVEVTTVVPDPVTVTSDAAVALEAPITVARGSRAVAASSGVNLLAGATPTVERGARGVRPNTVSIVDPVIPGVTGTTTVTTTIEIPTTPVTLDDGTTVWDIGTYGASESYTDITAQAALQDKAEQRAAELRTFTPTYTVTLKDGWWEGPEHIWLGDTIRLIIRSGRINEDVALRVTAIDLTLGDNGEETVSLTVGPTRRSEMSVLLAHSRRLALLERTRSY